MTKHQVQIYQYDSIDSTQTTAKALLEDSKIPFAVLTKEQINGRGRMNRKWDSPIGNLYMSLVIPIENHNNINILPLAVACVISQIISYDMEGYDILHKWPNDIILDGSKVAGILIECINPKVCIIGIGMNIDSHPTNIDYPATHISIYNPKFLDQYTDIYSIANMISLNIIKKWDIAQNNPKEIIDHWLKSAYKLGENITIKLPNETVSGIFVGLNDNGSMIIDNEGKLRDICYGDVS